MNPQHLGDAILNLIETKYPGGSEAFISNGGCVCPLPISHICLIYSSMELPKSFISEIEKINETSDIKFEVVHDINFEGLSLSTIYAGVLSATVQITEDLGIEPILFNLSSPIVMFISVPDTVPETDMENIAEIFMNNLPNLKRGIIINNKCAYPFGPEDPLDNDTQILANENSIRTEMIDKDYITDLKITLSQDCDVLDLIKKL